MRRLVVVVMGTASAEVLQEIERKDTIWFFVLDRLDQDEPTVHWEAGRVFMVSLFRFLKDQNSDPLVMTVVRKPWISPP